MSSSKQESGEGMNFGLLYFSSGEGTSNSDKYRLVIEGAKYADRHGFSSVWIPERHFTQIGCIYPNPAVVHAALARETQRIGLRAGSVVLPLHDPIRVAEEWSVVDNLSDGRVGVAFASGWHPNDFVFFPDKYANRYEEVYSGIEVVQRLWRGESIKTRGGDGNLVEVKIYPTPIQSRLPFWITAAGNPNTFIKAGEIGANLLTHLFTQTIEEVAEKIALYREALVRNGHDAYAGQVTMMLHTYIGEDIDVVREQVREPFCQYLKASKEILKGLAYSKGQNIDLTKLSEKDIDDLADFVFERFFSERVLFGTPKSCVSLVEQLRAIGVDEIACQLDFGMNTELILESLPQLNKLREACASLGAVATVNAQPIARNGDSAISVTTAAAETPIAVNASESTRDSQTSLPNDIKVRCSQEMGGPEFYEGLRARGVQYPAGLRAIEHLWRRDGEALGLVRLLAALEEEAGYYRIHPAFLDTCFQVLLATLPATSLLAGGECSYASAGLRDFRIHDQPGKEVWSHAVLRSSVSGDPVALEGDIHLLDVDGRVLVEALGLRLQRTEAPNQGNGNARSEFLIVDPENACGVTPGGIDNHKTSLTRERLIAAPAEERLRLLESHLKERVARVLRLPASKLDVTQPLNNLGLDSLMAIELKNHVESDLGLAVPVIALLKGPSITEFATRLLDQLQLGPAPEITNSALAVNYREAYTTPLVSLGPTVTKYPLSYGQQAMWFLSQLAPESAAYNVMFALRITSELDTAALRRSFQTILERHASLRSTFALLNDQPVQRIQQNVEVYLDEVDASALSEAELDARLTAESHCPFNLEEGPVMRVNLFTRSAADHVLLLTVHHIATDLWSLVEIVDELRVLYLAETTDAEASLPPVEMQYADYVRWQSEMLAGPEGERLWSYWQRQLSGELPVLNLPTDKTRPTIQTYRGASHHFELNAELTRRLKALGREHGSTIYMTLLAAFQVLLHRHTGQMDITVGTPTAGRSRSEFSKIFGYFVNPLVMRADFSGDLTFDEFLNQVRQTVFEAFEHQDYPFPLLVERLHPERDPSRAPLFQAMFVLQKAHLLNDEGLTAFALGEAGGQIDLGGLLMESMHLQHRVAQFDITLMVAEAHGGLHCSFDYNTDLFEPETIERLAGHLQVLLEGVVSGPEQRVSELPLLLAGERQQLLVEWNETQSEVDLSGCVHEMFEAQVERTPEAIAVVYESERLSYRELNERANQVGHKLRELGVRAETRVGILLERGVEMVVALLGTLKAGGAYVPLEPTYPAGRLQYMVADAGVTVVLTQERWRGRVGETAARVVCLDGEWAEVGIQSKENVGVELTAGNLAYVIYTSGSTGQPKGAMNTHEAISNRLQWMQLAYELTSADRVLQKTPYSFDVSVWEFFWPLLNGSSLVVARPGGHQEPSYLRGVIADEQVTVVHFVPSMLSVFLEEAGLEQDCASLRLVVCSGEALTVSLQERYYERLGARLENLYGPTEAAVDVTSWSCERGSGRGSVPIGRAIANVELYILDQSGRAVPVGVAGELYLGGVCVGRGYEQRAGLTAERFVPHPYSGAGGARLYRTGDLTRYLADGNIEYLGRLDHQVKVRGFRIELGEIEAGLATHSGIREAVVVAREEVAGDQRLVAYVTGEPGTTATVSELRQHLQERMPEYMVPSAFVMLDELPLTPNGKVDRRALPAPTALSGELEEPRTPIEELLVNIWREVLRVEQVSVTANFFELGGHSLLATQLISRVRATFAVEVPLRTLFERPTVVGLAERVEEALRGGEQTELAALERVARDGELPLSFAQQRLWFLEQLEPGTVAYNMPAGLRLTGQLEVSVLERVLNEIVRRHEVLRTSFAEVEGRAIQVITPALRLELPVVDLSELDDGEREQEVRRLTGEEAQRPFDLRQAPLLRVTLLRLGETEHVVLFTMHHIVSDGWSLGVLVEEVAALYRAYAADEESPLAELPVQYADYAIWQREQLQGVVLEKQLSYWSEQLGAAAVLELPTDHARPAVQSYRGAKQAVELSSELTQQLKELSRRQGVTLFMTLLAAFQTLLSRYSGQEDIVVGTPIAGRTRLETEQLIGFFVNTLALRTDLSGSPTFVELLERVREVTLGAYAHQDVPFEKLVDELRLERDLSRAPLFQVMLVLQNAPGGVLELPGLSISGLGGEAETSKYDLTLTLTEQAEQLVGSLEYSTELFERETMERLAGHLQVLLAALVTNPEQSISTVPLLSPAEMHKLLVEWNDTDADRIPEQCLHELFAAQAERTPEAVAVVAEGDQLTYRELHERANQLAHYLQGLGVGPETLVGVMMERGTSVAIALMAVHKAGGAYVALDPWYPHERLRFMMLDSRASVLLTNHDLYERVLQGRVSLADAGQRLSTEVAEIVFLEDMGERLSQCPVTNPSVAITPQNLAYMIYTSGSTGRPKGIAIEHRSAVSMVHWAHRSFAASHLAGVLASTSLCFDLSIFEFFVPLTMGGKVIVAENALQLPTLRAASEVTLINTVPSAMTEVLRLMEIPESVKVVNLAGEALSQALVEQIYDQTGAEEVWNLYGPSEDTTYSTYAFIPRGSQRTPPIGRPIANSQAYVLDAFMQLVPIGVSGELYLGGKGLARGYHERAELTAERFVPDPWHGESGGRLYRTGDLARYTAEGELEYQGRMDHQVKVRGFRIELGEIEAGLATHWGIRQAVAVVREEVAGDQRLVAYVTCEPGTTPTVSELRQHLQERMPEYMVPSAFVMLEELPLTPNGKVDRRALPAPTAVSGELEGELQEPRTPIEELLVNIWREVLRVEQVSVTANFFELGGHSLLATQLISRVRAAFAVEVPLRTLFERPTVAGLAERVEETLRGGEQTEIAALERVARDGELPLSFAQQRLWFLEQLEPGTVAYNMPAGLRLAGQLEVSVLERVLNEIVRRHEVLRTSFAEVEGRATQVIAPSLRLELPVVDLSELDDVEREQEVRRLTGEEAQRPFDLKQAPLLRVTLLRLGETEHVVLFTMHHIVSDGWSLGVLVAEVAALYRAYAADEESPLAELPVQYADYAIWQREQLQGAVLEKQLSYWSEQLGAAAVLELPTDHARPAVQSYRGAKQAVELSSELTQQLKELSRREGVTLFMTLLAGFQTLLSRYSGQEDIVVGTPIAGRTRLETEQLIGFFVNTLALRTDLSGSPTFVELLGRVREVTLGAYAHQDVPFEKLVDELRLERDLSRAPLFQVWFNLLNFREDQNNLTLDDLTMEIIPVPELSAKFDLNLYAQQRNDVIHLELVYNTELFDAGWMVEMLEQFIGLLTQIADCPEEKITRHSLMTPKGKLLLPDPAQTLDAEWEEAVHIRFSKNALRVPEASAIVDSYESWSYRELDTRSNQLANYLHRNGIQPGDNVAIYGHRSASLVWAVLGVLKAGAGFLILDPNYPASRLIACLDVAKPNGWLQIEAAGEPPRVLKEFGETLPCGLVLPQRAMAEASGLLSDYSIEAPAVTVGPDDLAYIAFTSGSTGVPKGVIGVHRPLSHFLQWHSQTFGLCEQDRFSMLSGLSHDPLLRDIFTPLWLGATLVIPDAEDITSPGGLFDWMNRERISVSHLTPAMGHLLANYAPGRTDASSEEPTLGSLRYAFFGGDTLNSRDVSALRAFAPSISCVNFYGTTETPQAMGYFVVPIGTDKTPSNSTGATKELVPVGKGIDGVQLLVLDALQKLAGICETGEIYVRTPYLTRGYVDDEGLTNDRFITNPETNVASDRLYKTGDTGRYLPDGNVEVLGRLDHQVKVRGFRIELGEIEAGLATHSGIREAVVVAREEVAGDQRLVAYVTGEPGTTATVSELRQHLQERMPEYMVPSAFVMLEELPLTPNGKVDRRALPAPTALSGELEELQEPRTPIEELLVNIWREVLRVEQVSVTANFFELGGHSLLATQLISRVRATFAVEVPLRSLFERPTVAGLAERVEEALRGGEQTELAALERVARDGELPLSFAQQRLWFLEQLEPGTVAYNMPAGLRLTGQLEVSVLERVLNEIVRRHEVLRTSFAEVEGRATQMIAPSLRLELPVVNLSDLDEGEREQEVRRLTGEEAQRPFDLRQAPLLRVTLLRLGETEHVVLFTMHHIVSDGWSLGVLVEEVAALYRAYAADEESPLAELPVQYADYAIWQREQLQGAVLEKQLSYWSEQLGAAAVLEMPTDHARPAVQSYRGAKQAVELSSELTQQLKELSRRQGVTLFMTLLAAFQTLLSRYSGQEDIVVGTPIAGRTRLETEQLIGFFVNTLALRTDLSGSPTFVELLGRVREVTLGAYAHQDVPFEKLVDELRLERDLSRAPLFQVMLVLQNAPGGVLELPGLSISGLGGEAETSKYDLTLTLTEQAEQLVGSLEYSTELFERETMERLAGHLQVLLAALVTNPEQSISTVPLLSPAEMHKLLVEWNETESEVDLSRCVHEMFEAQVERTPEAIAVVYESERLSYRELNERANQVGHKLRELGVRAETRVGILLERGVEMVVALLGTLKAGGAYVPLEPTYPAGRLQYMVADAGVTVVLTQERWRGRVGETAAAVVCLDGEWAEVGIQSKENVGVELSAGNLAYVIYTSGSTGQPKGAMNTHEAISNRLQWMQAAYELTSADRVLQKTPYSFDVSVWEFFWPLLNGSSLVVARPGGHQEPSYLRGLIADEQVTVVHFVPSMLSVFLEEAGLEQDCASLRLVVCSGEALTVSLQERYYERLGARLENLYGPTEAAVDVTSWSCERGSGRGSVPIGRAIANVELYILDQSGQAVPVGVAGELYLGGVCVGRGYEQRAGLTAERFVPHPYSGAGGARLYRTGDLTRYLADGNIEYLGRLDHQVKVRGFRIELGEIEAALSGHPGVRESSVQVREDMPGVKRIVGYIVWGSEGAGSVTELRQHLQERLPEYMVPSAFVVLDELPLTQNGKLDSRALPAPEQRPIEEAMVLPRNSAEEKLAGVWAEVLGLKTVGVHDNFFELGGDSILSIQIVARARREGLHLTPKQLFQSPTVAGLVAVAGTTARVEAAQGLITGEVALTPIQHWFYEQDVSDPHHWNQSALLEVREELDGALLEQALQHLLEHHDALRLRFSWDSGQWRQVNVGLGEAVPFVRVDLSEISEAEQKAAIEGKATALQESLNLSAGPLLRVALFELGGGRASRLLIAIHHLLVDSVSWRILLEDLQSVYGQLSRGEAVELPAKTTSYQQWAQYLTEHARSESLAEDLKYWQAEERGEVRGLPVDGPGGNNDMASARAVSVSLSAAETQLLLQEVPKAYRTQINDVLLTALTQSFGKWTGERSLLVNLEGHGREEIFAGVDLSRTVGWFTTIFPVLLELEQSGGPAADLKSIKEQLRRIPNRGISYGVLRYLSEKEGVAEQLRSQPQAEVSFNYLGQFSQVLSESSLFVPSGESSGAAHSQRGRRPHLLEINGGISADGRLQLVWSYSEELHRRATIEGLAEDFMAAIRELIACCGADNAGGYTPSDFPLAKLEQRQLDLVVGTDRQLEDLYPLTPMQEGMLLHHLYAPESGMNIEQLSCLLHGKLEVGAFERAWQRAVERHTILRTYFIWEQSEVPLQAVRQQVKLTVAQLDLRGQSETEQQARLEEFLQADKKRGFDLSQPVLMRLTIMRMGELDYHFAWTYHHLLVDGWSLDMLVKEVFASYKALLEGSEPTAEQGSPYRDYIAWLAEQSPTRAESFWRETLKNFTAPTPLVTAPPLQLSTVERYEKVKMRLSEAATASLQSVARQHQITLNTFVQGAWALLLSHYSGEQDIVFGVTVSGRPERLAGVETMIGLFINTLPLRVQITEGATLARWLQELQTKMVELREYEYSRLVQQWSEVPLSVPLFESLLVFENYPVDASLREQKSIEIRDVRSSLRTKYPLTVVAGPGTELWLYIAYDCRRIDEETAAEVVKHFQLLLEGMAADAGQPLAELMARIPKLEVNRRAQPLGGDDEERIMVLPQTQTEGMLASIWREVLGLEEVSVTANFFELGGHSLLATQLISRVRAAFAVEVPLRTLFERPTVVGLAERVEEALRGGEQTELAAIERVARGSEAPLSFAQQRLWFLEQLDPGSVAYNVPTGLRLEGRLEVSVLERVLNEIVRRHEVLRTSFQAVGGEPVQMITPSVTMSLPVTDLSDLEVAEREAEVKRLATAEAQRPFDLRQAPLLRANLLRLGETEHVVLFTMHHIVSDGWSLGVLVEEVAGLYRAYATGEESPLAELPVQYAGYAIWQREYLQGEVLEKQLSYWKHRLGGQLPVLELPTDHARPAVQSYRGAKQAVELSSELTQQLKELSRREGVTLFMTLLAAFQTLLSRYSGQEDIVVGTPIAGRTRLETEQLIGFFVNTLALRTDLSGSPTFVELLGRVREVTLGAYAHQDVPFEKLVDELRLERDLSRAPLFQVMLVLQNAPGGVLELPGLSISGLGGEAETSKYDLTLTLTEQAEQLVGSLEYSTELFERETMERLAGHLQVLLAALVTNPEQSISTVPLLSPAEMHKLLVEWNETESEVDLSRCVHEMFEAQVERTPEAIAVVYESERLSYRELNERANQVGHKLRELGVRAETRVGILLERGVEMVVALLGTLKAGGAYVPLEPTYPAGRLQYMVADAGVTVVLTQERWRGRVGETAAAVVCLDGEWAEVGIQSKENVGVELSAGNLAYVIYTSGSTGQPKGAMNTHEAISNRLQWMQAAYELTSADRVLQKTPYSFDVSVWEFFWPLLNGSSLVVARPGGHQEPSYLRGVIADEQVTVVHFVPSMLSVFLEEAGLEQDCASLRLVVCSGEALTVSLQERYYERLGARLENLYGPTEAAVDVTSWSCERGSGRGSVPIGRAIANVELYILDQSGRAVPVGVAGELYLGGVCVGRGYEQRAGLTAERFVPHPYSRAGGARLYRTGDLTRYLADGNIEYLGRLDHQVKVRGFRIELGEIEAALATHSGIREAVVVAREEVAGDQRLVAYVTGEPGMAPTVSELRQHLQERMPEYMVPSAFVMLDELPLTPNGKVDRRALPAPTAVKLQEERLFVEPRTIVEREMAKIWKEILGVERVSMNDNFFELGGHSLLLTKLVSQMWTVFQIEVPLRALFDAPTVVEMTMAIAARQVEAENAEELSQMLEELKQLSPEEVTSLLELEEALA